MDVFSLGVLCLWLMFKDQLSSHAPVTLDIASTTSESAAQPKTCGQWQRQNLGGLKTAGKLTLFAESALERSNLDEKQKMSLGHFFGLTLAHDPDKRDSDLRHLLNMLAPDGSVCCQHCWDISDNRL